MIVRRERILRGRLKRGRLRSCMKGPLRVDVLDGDVEMGMLRWGLGIGDWGLGGR